MARDSLNAAMARQHQDELRRLAERRRSGAESVAARGSSARPRPQEGLTIRLAAADRETKSRRVALRVLAWLSRSLIAR
jgi:hypothetical protein